MLRGGQHGQHGSTIAVGVAVSSAEDALAVLPQDLETAIPMGAKSRGRFHCAGLRCRAGLGGRTLDQPRQLERRLPQKNNRAAKTVPAPLISGVRILAGSK